MEVVPTPPPPRAESNTRIAVAGHTIHGKTFDIGGGNLQSTLKTMLQKRLFTKDSAATPVLPTALLSDDVGLEFWRTIIRLPTWYQTRDEVVTFERFGSEIADHITEGMMLIDLGCGDTIKVKPLLDAIETQKKRVSYFGLDLSKKVLEDNMQSLAPRYQYVTCAGLWGTFDDVLDWIKDHSGEEKCWLSLGGVLGNDFFDPAVARLMTWADQMQPHDRLLLSQDGGTDEVAIWKSYGDDEGLFERFLRNGLSHSNRVLGVDWYRSEDWAVQRVMQTNPIMHKYVFRAERAVECMEMNFMMRQGESIDCYESFKYGPEVMRRQFALAGLHELAMWESPASPIYDYMLCKRSQSNTT